MLAVALVIVIAGLGLVVKSLTLIVKAARSEEC